MEGARIARQQKQGGSMAKFLHMEPAKPLRNHAAANVRAIRETQQRIREDKMRAELEDTNPQKWKMQQFQGIQSKFREAKRPASREGVSGNNFGNENEDPRTVLNSVKASTKFLKRGAGASIAHKSARGDHGNQQDEDAAPKKQTRAGVPTREEIARRVHESEYKSQAPTRNFISVNRQKAKESEAVSMKEFEAMADQLKAQYAKDQFSKDESKVPTYLTDIKNGLEDKKRRQREDLARRDADAAIPDGYKLLSNEERLETLANLEEKHKALEESFRKLPLKIQTEGQKQRQREIQQKLTAMEKAIVLFQKPKVLVALDS